jgi:hypothetical protein
LYERNMKVHQPQHDGALLTNLALWVAFFLGPAAWAVHLQVVYAASQQVCDGTFSKSTLHIISALCLIASVVGGLLAMALWLRAGAVWPSERGDDLTARARLLSAEAMLTSLLFSLVIIAQWLSVLYYSPCAY